MAKIEFIPPNTDEWYQKRIGRFTSSEIYRLLGSGKRPMTAAELRQRDLRNKKAKQVDPKAKADVRTTIDTLFSTAALKYIDEKVAEIINKKAKFVPITKPMQWGMDNERDAVEYYTKITGRVMQESGLFIVNDYTAGTPDSMYVVRNKIKGINEVKCLNSENHSKFCECQTAKDVIEFDESFYAQSQMNMMVCGDDCKWCDIVSFDPRVMGYDDNGELIEENYDESKFIFAIHIVRIKRDEAFLKDLRHRLDKAIEIVIKKLNIRMKAAEKNRKMYERTLKKLNQNK